MLYYLFLRSPRLRIKDPFSARVLLRMAFYFTTIVIIFVFIDFIPEAFQDVELFAKRWFFGILLFVGTSFVSILCSSNLLVN